MRNPPRREEPEARASSEARHSVSPSLVPCLPVSDRPPLRPGTAHPKSSFGSLGAPRLFQPRHAAVVPRPAKVPPSQTGVAPLALCRPCAALLHAALPLPACNEFARRCHAHVPAQQADALELSVRELAAVGTLRGLAGSLQAATWAASPNLRIGQLSIERHGKAALFAVDGWGVTPGTRLSDVCTGGAQRCRSPLPNFLQPDLSGLAVEGTPEPVVPRDSGFCLKSLQVQSRTRRHAPSRLQVRPKADLRKGRPLKTPREASIGGLAQSSRVIPASGRIP
eukprot:970957-Amphidinium_carterae.1